MTRESSSIATSPRTRLVISSIRSAFPSSFPPLIVFEKKEKKKRNIVEQQNIQSLTRRSNAGRLPHEGSWLGPGHYARLELLLWANATTPRGSVIAFITFFFLLRNSIASPRSLVCRLLKRMTMAIQFCTENLSLWSPGVNFTR